MLGYCVFFMNHCFFLCERIAARETLKEIFSNSFHDGSICCGFTALLFILLFCLSKQAFVCCFVGNNYGARMVTLPFVGHFKKVV